RLLAERLDTRRTQRPHAKRQNDGLIAPPGYSERCGRETHADIRHRQDTGHRRGRPLGADARLFRLIAAARAHHSAWPIDANLDSPASSPAVVGRTEAQEVVRLVLQK